jgi:hypothetical protein
MKLDEYLLHRCYLHVNRIIVRLVIRLKLTCEQHNDQVSDRQASDHLAPLGSL